MGLVWIGGELEWCRASGLAPGKRQQASAFQGLRLGMVGEADVRERVPTLGGEGGLDADVGEGGG